MFANATEDATLLARPQPSIEEQKAMGAATAAALEALNLRLRTDEKFVEELTAHPRSAMGAAGIVLQKEGIEFLMAFDPAKFDQLTDELYELLDPSILVAAVGPSCDMLK